MTTDCRSVSSQLAGLNRSGRRKGVPNRFSSSIKEMVLAALNDVGGREYLARQAEANPVAFLGLIGKVLPLQLANTDGNDLVIDFRWADAPSAPAHAPPVIEAEVEPEAGAEPESDAAAVSWAEE